MHDYEALGYMIVQELINIRSDFKSEIQRLGDRLEKCLNLQPPNLAKECSSLKMHPTVCENTFAENASENLFTSNFASNCVEINVPAARSRKSPNMLINENDETDPKVLEVESSDRNTTTYDQQSVVFNLVSNQGEENELLSSIPKVESHQVSFPVSASSSLLREKELFNASMCKDASLTGSGNCLNVTDVESVSSKFQQSKIGAKIVSKSLKNKCKITVKAKKYERPKTECTICHKLIRNNYFHDHLSTHSKNKPYSCQICSKSFSSRANMERHMCLHTGVYPFSCQVCGKKFTRKDRFVNHLRFVHEITPMA